MTKKAADKVQILLDCLRRPDVERIYLFGSWARGHGVWSGRLDSALATFRVL